MITPIFKLNAGIGARTRSGQGIQRVKNAKNYRKKDRTDILKGAGCSSASFHPLI
jgi:hypothetical protein